MQADSNDLRSLAAEISERTTRHELHQSINNHVKPLTTALTSLEAAISIQENMARQNVHLFQDKVTCSKIMYICLDNL